VIVHEIDIVIQPTDPAAPDAGKQLKASVTIDESAMEALLRFLAQRQRRVWAD
jgi:hypothetical protein